MANKKQKRNKITKYIVMFIILIVVIFCLIYDKNYQTLYEKLGYSDEISLIEDFEYPEHLFYKKNVKDNIDIFTHNDISLVVDNANDRLYLIADEVENITKRYKKYELYDSTFGGEYAIDITTTTSIAAYRIDDKIESFITVEVKKISDEVVFVIYSVDGEYNLKYSDLNKGIIDLTLKNK